MRKLAEALQDMSNLLFQLVRIAQIHNRIIVHIVNNGIEDIDPDPLYSQNEALRVAYERLRGIDEE